MATFPLFSSLFYGISVCVGLWDPQSVQRERIQSSWALVLMGIMELKSSVFSLFDKSSVFSLFDDDKCHQRLHSNTIYVQTHSTTLYIQIHTRIYAQHCRWQLSLKSSEKIVPEKLFSKRDNTVLPLLKRDDSCLWKALKERQYRALFRAFQKRDNTELFSELFRALYSLSLMTDDTTVIKEREYRALFRT